MRNPAIRVLLLIFVGQDRFERSPVKVETQHISSRECPLWRGREKKLIDGSGAKDANGRFFGGGGWVATIRRTQGPLGVSCTCGQSKSVRLVPVSRWVIC